MKVRLTFRSEVFIEGETMQEVKDKWMALPIFSADALEEYGADTIEMVSVEDEDTYEDLMEDFNDAD